MKPEEQNEEVYTKIALIESFYVLVHDRKDMYMVVEKKHIPENALIIESPVFRFLHETLVNSLVKCGAKFKNKQKVQIVNKALNEVRNDFLVVEPDIKVKFSEIHKPDYKAAVVSELEETGTIFFAKEAVEKLRKMGLSFEELPAYPNIIPIGSA
jgi:hypothetical protein